MALTESFHVPPAIRPGVERYAARNLVLNFLFEPYHQRCREKLQQIIDRNNRLSIHTRPFFLFRGTVYPDDPVMAISIQANGLTPLTLDRSLTPDMLGYLADVHAAQEELPYIQGYLAAVFSRTPSVEDWLKVFPECIQRPVHEYTRMPGYRPSPPSLSASEIRHLNQVNARAITAIKFRLMANTLI